MANHQSGKTKVALIIIYNHRYDENIEILERIYHDRFSHIYHLMPFYQGQKNNVIPIYESSYYFQGYIAQGLKHYFKEEYSHYFFIADDLLLNPIINENNYTKHLQLDSDSCFLDGFVDLHEENFWAWTTRAVHWDMDCSSAGAEIKHQLPSYDQALRHFKKFNLSIKPIGFKQVYGSGLISYRRMLKQWAKQPKQLPKTHYHLPYPMVCSYSDMVVVSAGSIEKFAHYCGVFAAGELFVELALPTSLVLSTEKIITNKNLTLKSGALWSETDYKILQPYDYSLKKLLAQFPANYLYLHPIKLSKWNTKL
ncbi:hypothetical protein SPONL_547 [uncultured Candidatus Thioglobus sp.]|nr:hypothetical protein SPONL_547 [uncultured Candidatus Thioglobus sp.]